MPKKTQVTTERYDADGTRLTDCCGAFSTYHMEPDGSSTLCCRACWREVPYGQGDGTEKRFRFCVSLNNALHSQHATAEEAVAEAQRIKGMAWENWFVGCTPTLLWGAPLCSACGQDHRLLDTPGARRCVVQDILASARAARDTAPRKSTRRR